MLVVGVVCESRTSSGFDGLGSNADAWQFSRVVQMLRSALRMLIYFPLQLTGHCIMAIQLYAVRQFKRCANAAIWSKHVDLSSLDSGVCCKMSFKFCTDADGQLACRLKFIREHACVRLFYANLSLDRSKQPS